MAELTLAQQQAVALARARRRRLDAGGSAPVADPATVRAAQAANPIVQAQAAKFPTNPITGIDDPMRDKGALAIAGDQAVSNVEGAANFIPGMLRTGVDLFKASMGGPKAQAQFVKDAVTGMVKPVQTMAKNVSALDDAFGTQPFNPLAAPTTEENRGMAETSGANAMGLALGLRSGKVNRVIPQSANLSDQFAARSATNQTRALAPTSMEHKAIAQRIAPKLAEEGVGAGLTGKAYDADVFRRLEEAGTKLAEAETRIMSNNANPAFRTDRASLSSEVEAAMEKLKVKGTRTVVNPEAYAELRDLKAQIDSLPPQINPEQLIDYSRKLSQRVNELGGFKATGADRVKVNVIRGVDNLVRGAKNRLPDPDWAAANKEYSLYRNAADIVERRELRDVGKSGLQMPGRGSVLDDVLATWAGHALGGPVGAISIEAANLIRQSRGWANVKSRAQSQASKMLKP